MQAIRVGRSRAPAPRLQREAARGREGLEAVRECERGGQGKRDNDLPAQWGVHQSLTTRVHPPSGEDVALKAALVHLS